MKKLLALMCATGILWSLFACREEPILSPTEPDTTAEEPVLSTPPEATPTQPQSTQAPHWEALADETEYFLDMTLETGSGFEDAPVRLAETAAITFTNTSDTPWDEICLRDYSGCYLSETRWIPGKDDDFIRDLYIPQGIQRVTDINGDVLSFQAKPEDPSVVYVSLGQLLEPGWRTTIVVSYQTLIPFGGQRLSWHTTQEDPDKRTVFLSQAYPMLAEYSGDGWDESPYTSIGECFHSSCASFCVTLRLPEEYTVISTGEEAQSPEGVWRLTAENVRDLGIVASNDFQLLTTTSQGITVNCWFYSDSPQALAWGTLSLQAAADALAAYTALWGEYPYGELDVVQTYFDNGGMEYPGLVRVTDMLALGLDIPAVQESLQLAVAHETAHQWFYAVVGNDQYREPWLDESLASYAELAYLEYLGETEEELAARIRKMDYHRPGQYIDLDCGAYSRDSYGQLVYRQGSVFFWKLRQAMGKQAFDAFLESWYQENLFALVTASHFREALNRAAGDDPQVRLLMEQYLSP